MDTLKDVLEPFLGNRYLQALILILASLFAARVVDWILIGGLSRWVSRTDTDLDDRVLSALHRPIFTSVLLAGLWLATVRLELPLPVARFTLASLQTVAVIVWLFAGVRVSSMVLASLSRAKERLRLLESQTLPLFDNVAKIILFGGAIYFIFLAWNVNVTAWLTSVGIIGIAVGFAAKDTLANLFAGVFIFADAPYKIGDFIVLDTGERGRVTQIGIRSTRLLTQDDIEITMPNAVIGNAKIVNESGGPWEKERIRVRVGVAYGSDIDRVRAILMEIAVEHPSVCDDPEPRVRFRAFGESGLDLEVLAWIDEPALRGQVLDALNTTIYKRFNTEGIEIPYPKRDLYIHRMPGSGD